MRSLAIFCITSLLLPLGAYAEVLDIGADGGAAKAQELGSTMRGDPVHLRQVQEAFDASTPEDSMGTFVWRPGAIYKVRMRQFMATTIKLPDNERVSSYVLGDDQLFTVQHMGERHPNIMTVYSVYAGVDTNLNVMGESGRVYSFYLRNDSTDSEIVPQFYVDVVAGGNRVHSWQFDQTLAPQGEEKKVSDEQAAMQRRADSVAQPPPTREDYLQSLPNADKINASYKLYGDAEIAPYAVYDDGRLTYFDFTAGLSAQRLLALYQVVDGYDSMVNYRYEKGLLVAEGISKEGWTLRNGNQTVCAKPTKMAERTKKNPLNTPVKSLPIGDTNAK
jgi:ComB9 competence protein